MNTTNISESKVKSLIKIAVQKHQSGQGDESESLYKTEVAEILQLAVQHQRANRLVEAELLYTQVLEKQPDHPEALYSLGILAQQMGLPETAEQWLSAALQIQPDSVKTWFSLGNLRLVQEQFSQAEKAYRQALVILPDSLPIYNNLGYALQQQGLFDEAINYYQKALELKPDFIEAEANLGNTLHAQGKLASEQQFYYAQLNHKLGVARKKAGDLKTAVIYHKQAIALQPDFLEAYYNLGLALQSQGELEKAIAFYQKLLQLNPNYGEVYLNLGKIYQQQNQFQKAVSAYRQGLKLINPHYAASLATGEDAEILQQVPVTPSIPQGEVIVGKYGFPAIQTVVDHTLNRPFWSVVVTVHNRIDYLLECLANVLAQWQGEEQMEIIVMDDASRTPVFELVNSIGQGIIHYYRNQQNLGLPGNWNAGIALTRGWWVHLLHDDDYTLPGFYSRLQESLEGCSDSVGAAFTGYQNINEKGEVIFHQQVYGQRGIAKNWLQRIGVNNLLNMPAVVIRREAHEQLGVYHPELTYTTDWELYKRIAAVYDWWYEPEILACYRQYANNMTSELLLTGKQMISIRRAIEISESYFPTEYCDEITTQSRSYHFIYCLKSALTPLRALNLTGAWQVLEEALKIDHSPKAIAKLFSWLTQEETTPLRETGYIQKVLGYYQQAIALEPDLSEVYYDLGNILQEQEQLEEAIASYHQALKLNPQNWEIYNRLGQVYQIQNQIAEAISVYRQGLTLLNPHYAKAVAAYQNAAITPEMLVTPPIPQSEITIGAYQFPVIPPVTNPEKSAPFWTVVIPVYNRTNYLLECLASVLVQWSGAEQMEILVIDNGSTPPLFDLVNSIGEGVIRYYRNQQNIGVLPNHNAGISLSRGQWIHVLHDDDCVLPGFYDRLQQSLQGCSDSIGAAFTNFEYFNQKGTVIEKGEVISWFGDHKGIPQNFLQKIGVTCPLQIPAVVIRRLTHEQLGGYHLKLVCAPEWELYKRIAVFYDWWYEPGSLARYRIHSQRQTDDDLSSGILATSIRLGIEISESYLPAEHRADITTQACSYNFNYCLIRVAIPLKTGNVIGALHMLQETLKLDRSPQAIAKLFTWLNQDETAFLRDEIAAKLFAISG
ncbi:tetratricopeptide repeat protein [Nostoc sp.]|uniref:tetratricopeptide repeat protein n=1 Tax=Nostoc sp. TaxID=1180 RepID=UPI002FF78F9A